jgi:hypothetical protein
MTWGETPLKIYTEEDMKKEGFNEEEVPEVEDNIKFDEEKEENENKKNTEENNDNLENQENNNEINNNSNNALIKESQKSLKGLKEEIPEEKKEEDKQFGDTIEEEELENESQIKNNEEEIKQPEEPKKKFFYYKETSWAETSFFWKAFYLIIDFPLTFIRELTIPILDNKRTSDNKLYIFPITNFIFLSYVFQCKFISFLYFSSI